MRDFKPFDDKYSFDKNILTEDFPDYILVSVIDWLTNLLDEKGLASLWAGQRTLDRTNFILPLSQAMRRTFSVNYKDFIEEIIDDKVIFRNVLSYIVQKHAYEPDARILENILVQTSSAYAVEINETRINEYTRQYDMNLIYRVSPIAKKQAEDILSENELLHEAWNSHYGMAPDDEKTVTRVTDALAGLLRDHYFPNEKRPQLGTLLGVMRRKPGDYSLPASSLYDSDKFLELMKDFSKIRGNHQSGTGRKPSHEEAGFVLHFCIMFFQLLKK